MSAHNSEGNKLFPIFLKLEELHLVIIGGGNVALEKLNAVIGNSPATSITMISIDFIDEIQHLVEIYPNIELVEKFYDHTDVEEADLIIAAVNDISLSARIAQDAKAAGKLVNIADKPALCDFYLGSIVKKGNLKIAISTNGKSPTIAKRLKENLDEYLPEEIDNLLDNMETIRNNLKGDLGNKIKELNKITKVLSRGQGSLRQAQGAAGDRGQG